MQCLPGFLPGGWAPSASSRPRRSWRKRVGAIIVATGAGLLDCTELPQPGLGPPAGSLPQLRVRAHPGCKRPHRGQRAHAGWSPRAVGGHHPLRRKPGPRRRGLLLRDLLPERLQVQPLDLAQGPGHPGHPLLQDHRSLRQGGVDRLRALPRSRDHAVRAVRPDRRSPGGGRPGRPDRDHPPCSPTAAASPTLPTWCC